MTLKDSSNLKEEDFKVLGASGIIRPDSKSIQVVLGTKAQEVAEDISMVLSPENTI